MKVSSELAQDRRAWSASVRDVVNCIGDAGFNPPRVNVAINKSILEIPLTALRDHAALSSNSNEEHLQYGQAWSGNHMKRVH